MMYFCADDYGISKVSNRHIEDCLETGVLNKISVLPNGEMPYLKRILSMEDKIISLHINLVEGRPLSNPEEIESIVSENGYFRYSFIGLLIKSLLPDKKKFEEDIYKELQSQIRFWEEAIGSKNIASIDSHQHIHMIPLVFKTLMRVIKDEGVNVQYIRIPAEPILPYILTPSLYFDYTITGVIKQWILKFLNLFNKKKMMESGIKTGYFIGIMFSGKMDERKIKKVLPHYTKLSAEKGKDIELCFHPGYVEEEELTFENREDFKKFYLSSGRKIEYDTLMNFKI